MEKRTKKEKGSGKEKGRGSKVVSKALPSVLREFSAGGVVFKRENDKLLWLIIKPKGTDRWQLPKGKIDKGEKSEQAALREVEEEGGVETKLLEKLGKSQYFFVWKGKKIFKTVAYFLMQYKKDTSGGHDWEVDEVRFTTFKAAKKLLTFKDDKEMLDKARQLLASGKQGNLV